MKAMRKRKETEALRAALAGREALSREETARAAEKLAPHVAHASVRLREARMERRSLRLQAWGLAGCSAAFAALMWFAYQYRAFLLAAPARWGLIAGFFTVALLVTVCLPVILRYEGEKQDA